MPVTLPQAGRWLPLRAVPDRGGLPLFCLPHAGGGASAYRAWLGKVPGVDVLPVQPPGREARLRDTPHEQMSSLVAELASVITEAAGSRPYAVYGHSLGALVAFETLREIRRRGGEQPVRLFASGCVAPHCVYDDGPRVTGMTQPEVVQMLRQLGGTPDWLLADPDVLGMILPAVRADFSVKESYSYVAEPPLEVPITVVASTADARAPHELQQRWQELTSAGCELHTLTGGHFAVFERSDLTLGYVAAGLRGWLAGSAAC